MDITPDTFYTGAAWMKEYARSKGIRNLAAQTAYFLIYGYTVNSERGYYYGTIATLQYWLEAASEGTVRRCLQDLQKAGLIDKLEVLHHGRMRPAYRARIEEAEEYRRQLLEAGDPSKIDPSKIDPSKIDPSIFNARPLKNCGVTPQKLTVDPSKIEGYMYNDNINKNNINTTTQQYTPMLRDNARELVDRAMEPSPGFIVPTLDEVRATLDQLTVKPPAWEIDECAQCFLDKMNAQGWRVRNWIDRLRQYSANWVKNHANSYGRPKRRVDPFQTIDSPIAEQSEDDIPW